MSLSGNLAEFSITEVFQILFLGRKTGVLKVTGQAEGFVYFRCGEAYYAVSTRYRKPIGQRLVEAGLVSQKEIDKALREQKGKGRQDRLGRILLDRNSIDNKVLESLIKEQIWDSLVDILSWDVGHFEFECGTLPTEEDIGISLEAWNKAVRKIPSFHSITKAELWVRIKKIIPHFNLVFALNIKRGEATTGISLSPGEWSLLCLVDGTKTVGDLIKESGEEDFHVCYTLYKLIKAELIEEVQSSRGCAKGRREAAKKAESSSKHGSAETADKPPLRMKSQLYRAERPAHRAHGAKTALKKDKKGRDTGSHESKSESLANRIAQQERSEPAVVTRNVAKARRGNEESHSVTARPGASKQELLASAEIRSLGTLEVWIGKEKVFAELFIVKLGKKTSNILCFPDGKYQFANDCFTPAEKKRIIEHLPLPVKKV